MNIARASINAPLITWLLMLGCLLGGLWGFNSVGRLEDPAFSIKQAVITTQYPGASAMEVAREVTEPIESSIQKLGEVDRITSISQPGVSLVEVEIKSTYDGSELPRIWAKLRNRVDDAARQLPAGTGQPLVNDTFGDVFGIFYAVSADGFSDAERHSLATFLRREILAVQGVGDVEVAGLPNEAIFVEPSLALSVNQHAPPNAIITAITNADTVAAAGALDAEQRTLIETPEGSSSVSEIAALSVGVGGEVLNLVDIATVSRGRQDDPDRLIRINGEEAFTLGVSGIADLNIVEIGKRVDARLDELQSEIPFGVKLEPIYRQHVVVEEASSAFLVNLAMSVGIVVLVLALFMGWRAAVVVGTTLLLTVVGTLFFMGIFSIEMQRISLGALIIAMGMLVDNAIVVAEGMQIAMRGGKSSRDAAEDTAGKTQIPLLGATVIGIMAFAGIGLSPDATGEFMFSLFAVIGISLVLSWILAITVTPLLGHYFFKQGAAGGGDAYDGPMFRAYGAILRAALRLRWVVVLVLIAITAASVVGFTQIKQQFFPDSNTPIFFVHYKLPQGTKIETTLRDMKIAEKWLLDRDDVVSVATFAGQGATRFMLTYSAEKPNPSYGHLIIQTETLDQIPALRADLEAFAAEALPVGEFRVRRLVFGPGGGDAIQVRISGADPDVLRRLGEEVVTRISAETDEAVNIKQNWRERELVLKPQYASDRAKIAGITRDDVASTLRLATDGIAAGVIREGDRQIPIIVRLPEADRIELNDLVIYSDSADAFLPIEQVMDGFAVESRDTLVHRRDRLFTLTVGADVLPGLTADTVQRKINGIFDEMTVPPGYRLEWGGERESAGDAQASLGAQLPISGVIMVLISLLLFNALRQPLIIWLLVPMSVSGVAIGLLATDLPFTFTALLGLLSLSGMLIKNGIVLVEEIDIVRRLGGSLRESIVSASKSRVRPVVLAAATTILGMVPLLGDAFFVSMAVTIMGGLAFASILTLIAAPVFYDIFFSREARRAAT